MNNKKLGIALVAILVIAIVGLFFPIGNPITQRVVGAVPTLDGIDHPFVKVNGQREWRGARGLTATSSVICAIQNPYGATSSIVALSAEATNTGIAEANNLFVSTSTSAFGSSTPALVNAFAMGTGQWSLELQKNSATTTDANGLMTTATTDLLPGMSAAGRSHYVLGPSEWVTFRIATGTAGTYSTYDVGECSAVFKKI